MATTINNPGIVRVADRVLLGARKGLMRAQLFATDFSADFEQAGATLKVPVITAGAAATFAKATGLTASSGTVTDAEVKLTEKPFSTFEFDSDAALNRDLAPVLARAAEAAGVAVGNHIQNAIVTALAGATGTASVSGISKASIAALRKAVFDVCKSRPADTVLLLSPGDYAEVLALFESAVYGNPSAVQDGVFTGSLFGFKAVAEVSALEDGTGYLVPADALAIAGRAYPIPQGLQYLDQGTVTDEETGLTLTVLEHGNTSAISLYLSVLALYGVALIDKAKVAKVTISAAE